MLLVVVLHWNQIREDQQLESLNAVSDPPFSVAYVMLLNAREVAVIRVLQVLAQERASYLMASETTNVSLYCEYCCIIEAALFKT